MWLCEDCEWEPATHRFFVSMLGWDKKSERLVFRGFLWQETCRECALHWANAGHAYGALPRRLEETTDEAFRQTRFASRMFSR